MTVTPVSEEIRASMIALAEDVSGTLNEEEATRATAEAESVAEGFLEYCKTGLDASIVAASIARLLAVFQITPLQRCVDSIDHSIVIYSLAAGALAKRGDEPAEVAESVNSQPADAAPVFHGAYL